MKSKIKQNFSSWEKLNEYAKEYHAEVQKGYGTEVKYIEKDDAISVIDNRSSYQKELADKIVTGIFPYLYKIAGRLLTGKPLAVLGNKISLQRFQGRISVDDLVDAAALKTLQSLHNYDPAKGALSTFITFTTAPAMLWYAKRNRGMIPLPIEIQDKISHQILFTVDATEKELVEDIMKKLEKDTSAAQTIYFGMTNKYITIHNSIPDENANTEQEAQQGELEEKVQKVLATLAPQEELVLRMRFGIGDDNDRSQREIGQELNVSKRRIQEIEAKAMKKLKHHHKSKYLQPFME
ncbi:MAG: sigma-70 family RNA polymerase sigma factor [Nanoarchaeota archaeon]|nr:sigma-70 family RNA polymerase sigma factor [Nanoarchaeota archaeon]